MRYLLVAVLILSLAAPAVMAGKGAVKVVEGKSISSPNTGTAKVVQLSKNVEKKDERQNTGNVQYRIVTLRGGKLSARVALPAR